MGKVYIKVNNGRGRGTFARLLLFDGTLNHETIVNFIRKYVSNPVEYSVRDEHGDWVTAFPDWIKVKEK